jgi:hypothetical protein
VVYRWVPSHEGVEGNEEADKQAKAAALGEEEGVKALAKDLEGWSLAGIQRRVTEAKWTETEQWWKEKLSKKAVYRMNKKRRMADEVSLAKKSIAARYLQLKVGHALTAIYLKRIKKRESLECWWCKHERQTRDHLFKWCKMWKRQQDILWAELKTKCKWKERIKVPMSQVFDTDEAVEPMLDFLLSTDVGRVTGVEEEAEEGGSSSEE